jgi:hypothetical protein
MNLDECTATVCLGSLSDDVGDPRIEHLQLTDELTEEFRIAAKKALRKYSRMRGGGELNLRPYDAGSKPDSHEVEFLDLTEHESVQKQIDSLASLAQIPVFKVDEAFVSGLRFYAIIFQCKNGKPLYFFRNYTPKKELSRSSLFAAMFDNGTFNSIKEPVFVFDHGVDCVSRDGAMYFFSKHNFEKIFQFFELVLKTAAQTLATIKTHVPIANFGEFENACSGLLSGHFLFCKSRDWSCEDEVRLVLPRNDGRIKVKFDPVWLTRIICGKAMSEENKNTIRLWAKERKPELAVAITYYDATQRAIKLRDELKKGKV